MCEYVQGTLTEGLAVAITGAESWSLYLDCNETLGAMRFSRRCEDYLLLGYDAVHFGRILRFGGS